MEVAAFRLGVYLFGRELRRVQRLVETKSVRTPEPFNRTCTEQSTRTGAANFPYLGRRLIYIKFLIDSCDMLGYIPENPVY
jgi:hypothetical protein